MDKMYVSRVSYRYIVTDSQGATHTVTGEHWLCGDFVVIGVHSFFRPTSVIKAT